MATMTLSARCWQLRCGRSRVSNTVYRIRDVTVLRVPTGIVTIGSHDSAVTDRGHGTAYSARTELGNARRDASSVELPDENALCQCRSLEH
jgi:hypothetical protein